MTRRSREVAWRLLLVLVVLVGAGALIVMKPPRLGLDLRGGTQITYEAQDAEGGEVSSEDVESTLEALRRRVDQLGVTEPTIQRSGDDRIIVELPGVEDPEEALEIIGRTAQLDFHPVIASLPAEGGEQPQGEESGGEQPQGEEQPAEGEDGEQPADGNAQSGDPELGEGELVLTDEDGERLHLGPSRLTGSAVGDARAELDPQTGTRWLVAVDFQGSGGETWAQLTGDAACNPVADPSRRVAIVLDEEIISSPQVDPSIQCDTGITGGSTTITGQFSQEEANDLALLIRAGALDVPIEVIEQRTIGATLGDAAIRASMIAAVAGALITILYIAVYYRVLGVLAGLALLVYGAVAYASLLALDATLTLPGLAGFVLAIGMAVDANVLIFERMREEEETGARMRVVIDRGSRGAIRAIVDSNLTTIIAAVILLLLSAGAVRGFGVTLSIGVIVSMFSSLVVTRLFIELAVRRQWVRAHPVQFGISGGGKIRRWLADRAPDLMGRARTFLTVSGIVVALAVAGLVLRGLNLGVEFTGGRLTEYSTTQEVTADEVRDALASAGFPRAVVSTTDAGNVSVRTGEVNEEQSQRVTEAVASVGGQADKVRDEFIGPTIGDELRDRALMAIGLALLAQLVYIIVRFRWTWGVSAVVAMAHDVLIVLGVFAWLQKPIDGVFVAAMLTVVGYSVNDSVVVFDRVREQREQHRRERLEQLVNRACLQTLPRTVNTGMGVLFILVSLYVFGGDTLRDFALALLIGVIVGSYSSLLTAAPLATMLERRWAAPAPVVRVGSKPTTPTPRPKTRTRTTLVTDPDGGGEDQPPTSTTTTLDQPDEPFEPGEQPGTGEPGERPADEPRTRKGTAPTRPVRPAGSRPRPRSRTDSKRRRRR